MQTAFFLQDLALIYIYTYIHFFFKNKYRACPYANKRKLYLLMGIDDFAHP